MQNFEKHTHLCRGGCDLCSVNARLQPARKQRHPHLAFRSPARTPADKAPIADARYSGRALRPVESAQRDGGGGHGRKLSLRRVQDELTILLRARGHTTPPGSLDTPLSSDVLGSSRSKTAYISHLTPTGSTARLHAPADCLDSIDLTKSSCGNSSNMTGLDQHIKETPRTT
ncbi:hypothetical protein BV25DRAFT_1287806 [Artomyces pyxidatus]|uniref:Uncharacterized protein n=1 Tax=Artomyces pyxidatus TaxID=48021 RepID=A0ACB8SPS6_9AGAM|nr:hypothetical protein BV25DRAFT_1287806 [Artomyces pyxidatus]